jgi:hypothetical protein
MQADRGRTLLERILALCLGTVLALQPVARAGTPCPARGSSAERSCCCGASSAAACCAPGSSAQDRAPVVRRDRCGCELKAPVPPEPIPTTVDPRGPRTADAGSTSDWIADGARASAATLVHALAFGPDPPDLGLTDPLCPGPDRVRLSEPCSAARSSAHGLHALLAALGSLLR